MIKSFSPDAEQAALALIAERAPGATICPSEVARLLAASVGNETDEWRDFMPAVHDAVDKLLTKKQVQLSWKGKPLEKRAGPYRIADGNVGSSKA